MAKTTTEFSMKKGIIDSINHYLAMQGYTQGEINGCPAWEKVILPALTFLMAKPAYHYIQFYDMGDKFILEEWVNTGYNIEVPVDHFSIFGGCIQQLICIKKHKELVNYINSL